MPIVFEEVQTEIAPERSAEPQRAEEARGTSDPGETIDKVKTELEIASERRARLAVD